MIDWEWTRHRVEPEDILDAARTIKVNETRILLDVAADWQPASKYLEWARDALGRGGESAWDSAAKAINAYPSTSRSFSDDGKDPCRTHDAPQ